MSEGIAMFILATFFWSNISGFRSWLHIQVGSHPSVLWTILGTWVACEGFSDEAWKGGGADSYPCSSAWLCAPVGRVFATPVSASLLSPTLDVFSHSVLRNSWLLSLDLSPPLCWKRAKRCVCVCANKAGAFSHLFPTSVVSYAKTSAWIFLSLLSPLVKCSQRSRSLRYHLKWKWTYTKGYPAIFKYTWVNPCGWILQAEMSFSQLYLLCVRAAFDCFARKSVALAKPEGTLWCLMPTCFLIMSRTQLELCVVSSCYNFALVCVGDLGPGDRTLQLIVIFGLSEPYPCTKWNLCRNILAQAPQKLALIVWLLGFVCCALYL